MTSSDVIKLIKDQQGGRSLRGLALEIECSAAYLSDIYNGKRLPGPKILTWLGLMKERTTVTTYHPSPKKNGRRSA